jgi:hypothetical protein
VGVATLAAHRVDDTVVDVVDLTGGARGEPLQLITIELRAREGLGIFADWTAGHLSPLGQRR